MRTRNLWSICLILLLVAVTINGQVVGENRPYDYSDKYYNANGVDHTRIQKRRSGFDKYSVPDFSTNRKFRDVRIIGTIPIGLENGDFAFGAEHGSLDLDSFTRDSLGREAEQTALRYPVYTFPSQRFRGQKRQHDILRTDDEYFIKNPLGLSVEIEVTLTDKGRSSDGQAILKEVLGGNGRDLDDGYLLMDVNEIERLTWLGLFSQTYRWENRSTVFRIMTLIQNPTGGSISSDAFLIIPRNEKGSVLESLKPFSDNFECLKKSGNWCGGS